MTRALNPTETYLQQRGQKLFEIHADPIAYEAALRDLVREVAAACGLYIAEMKSTDMFSLWVGHFLDRVVDVRSGRPQDASLSPRPVPKAPVQPSLTGLTPPPPPPRTYVRGGPRGPAVGAYYVPPGELKKAREALDWTLAMVAEKANLSGSHVGNLENGKAQGTRKHYKALRTALGLPIPQEAA